MEAYVSDAVDGAFGASHTRFDTLVGWLSGGEAAGLSHADLEVGLEVDGRALLRQLLQDHLDLRAERELRLADVVDANGHGRGTVEYGHDLAWRPSSARSLWRASPTGPGGGPTCTQPTRR